MKSRHKNPALAAAIAVAVAGIGYTGTAAAQGAQTVEEIVTIGSRRPARSVTDSAVPVDVISGDELVNMGFADLDEMLRTAVPSYNIERHAISDAATLVRPATLRGLPPDNVLILVNGKRRHRSGVIAELGGDLAEGSQGADYSSIPSLAFSRTEVLRDGAAAQYGSDAIAGVINFHLREDADGFTIEGRSGQTAEGDGDLIQFMGNVGMPLGDSGFLNVTGSWWEQDATSRSSQRTDAATLLRTGNPAQRESVREPYAQIWGAPEYRDNWNIFFNSGIDVSPDMEVYIFGNYGQRETEGGFFYRNPNSRSGVYTNGSVRAVVDTDIRRGRLASLSGQMKVSDDGMSLVAAEIGDTGIISNCPALRSPGSGGNGDDLNADAVAADYTALQNLPDNCWVLNSVVPGGYTPQFGGNLKDASIVGGIRGQFNNDFTYDFSASYGRNKAAFFLNNTWNPSNGPGEGDNPVLQRDFDIGAYVQSETNINADFVYLTQMDFLPNDLSVAFGFEWRDERFETIIGEVNAWGAGPYSFQNVDSNNPNVYHNGFIIGEGDDAGNPIDLTAAQYLAGNDMPENDMPEDDEDVRVFLPNLSIGAHGFAGFSPQQAGLWGRSNYAFYTELETDLSDRLTGILALRYEDFETFGDTSNFKLAGRYLLNERVSLRGSYNTGFRAPTPGQENVTKVSTTTIDGELQQRGQIPPTNPIARFLGGEALQPEESTNFSFGMVWDVTPDINVTVDYFQIELEDRISQTGTIEIGKRAVPSAAELQALGGDCPLARAQAGSNLATCLQELGVPGAADLNSVSFYTNDFATTTTGIDLVATYDIDWGVNGLGTLVAAWNWTETEVDDAGSEVDRNKVVNLERRNPHNRGVFTYVHNYNNFRFLARASYYDDYVVASWGDDPTERGNSGNAYDLNCGMYGPANDRDWADNCYDGEFILDMEAAYTFNEHYTLIVGANNILDETAPLNIDNVWDGTVGSGNTYDTSAPWGTDGAFYYVRLRAEF